MQFTIKTLPHTKINMPGVGLIWQYSPPVKFFIKVIKSKDNAEIEVSRHTFNRCVETLILHLEINL